MSINGTEANKAMKHNEIENPVSCLYFDIHYYNHYWNESSKIDPKNFYFLRPTLEIKIKEYI